MCMHGLASNWGIGECRVRRGLKRHVAAQEESDRLISMSKRLQVLLDEPELREIRRAARAKRMTVAEWVRGALREARRQEPLGDAARRGLVSPLARVRGWSRT